MITWNEFGWFAAVSSVFCMAGSLASWRAAGRRGTLLAVLLTMAGIAVYAVFIAAFWHGLGRPPLRTLGETRLWYSFFMMVSGLITYIRWRYRWILLFSTVTAMVFMALNLLRPEIHSQALMPALQSFWFVPHVTVYIFSYSLLACAFLLAVAGLHGRTGRYLATADTLVYVGAAFLALGMMSGALWAKAAWGHYWNWDAKETWAAVTWGVYLLYIHLRLGRYRDSMWGYVLLIVGFLCLQVCWYGVNYLPSAQGSMHVY